MLWRFGASLVIKCLLLKQGRGKFATAEEYVSVYTRKSQSESETSNDFFIDNKSIQLNTTAILLRAPQFNKSK